MENYIEIYIPYIEGEYKEDKDRRHIICKCPFCGEREFRIDIYKGLFYCQSCTEGGNATQFIARMEKISTKEAFRRIYMTYNIEKYAESKGLPMVLLEEVGIRKAKKGIKIPYFNEKKEEIAVKIMIKTRGKEKRFWGKGSKPLPYGIWKLKEFTDKSYIIITDCEEDALTLWTLSKQAIAITEIACLKKEYVGMLEDFNKIIIHNRINNQSKACIRQFCKLFPYEKLYTISAKKISSSCSTISSLRINKILDFNKLMETEEKIDKILYDEANKIEDKKSGLINTNNIDVEIEELEEHVKLAEDIMSLLYIKFYNENFYVFENGVYKKDLPLIEQYILEIKKNAKKSLRAEILDYIRIKTNQKEISINAQYINFKNGLFDIVNQKLIPHNPNIFTTCQINANYYEKGSNIFNIDMENFLDDVTSNNPIHKKTLLQFIGYSLTYRTDLGKALFILGPTANNRKKYNY